MCGCVSVWPCADIDVYVCVDAVVDVLIVCVCVNVVWMCSSVCVCVLYA